ncbi:MAG TPA: hypothetical protein VHM22_06895 [Bradyrhizobium sp.]|nr:hypothetical protein [Bradyrhizobium sp.]
MTMPQESTDNPVITAPEWPIDRRSSTLVGDALRDVLDPKLRDR